MWERGAEKARMGWEQVVWEEAGAGLVVVGWEREEGEEQGEEKGGALVTMAAEVE